MQNIVLLIHQLIDIRVDSVLFVQHGIPVGGKKLGDHFGEYLMEQL